MSKEAELHYDGNVYKVPVITGTENESAIDVSKLRGQSGLITLDRGFKNTGSCESAITFLDGEEGVLRYRGYSIEELAEKSTFLEVAFLLIYSELPTQEELDMLSFPSDKRDLTELYRGIPNRTNHNTGYKGRTAIHEILEVDNPMKKLIFDGGNQNEIKKTAINNGMTPLREAGISKIMSGDTTIDEILRATVEDI